MAEPKKVPENLEDLMQQPEYADVNEHYTIKQLQHDLKAAGVAYRSNDSKDDLVWRMVDSMQSEPEEDDADVAEELVEPEEDAKPQLEDNSQQDEMIVENKGAYNLLDPYSVTLFKARQSTVIKLAGLDKDKIIRNINQINATRGKVLIIR